MNPIFDTEAEAGLLGCFVWGNSTLADAETAFQDAIAVGMREDWFYDLRHKRIFKAIKELELSGATCDLIALKHALQFEMQAVGGLFYLASLPESTHGPSSWGYFADRCRDAMLRRKAAAIASEAIELAEGGQSGESTLQGLAERATQALDAAALKQSDDGGVIATSLLDNLEERKALADAGKRSGIATGLIDLDRMIDGVQPGEQFVIGARPSTGKTALGLSIVTNVAIKNSIPTLIISCEMSTRSLAMRLCSICASVSLKSLRAGKYFEDDFRKIAAFNATLAKSPLWIYNAVSGITGAQAAAIIRQHARQHGVKFVLVDYLQKLKADSKNEKRTYEIGQVSETLRSGAVASGVALLTLAQVNRDSDRGDKPRAPRLAELADSAQIERDADTIALLHRDRTENTPAKLIVAKQRDGETGMIDLHFNGQFTRFENSTESDTN